MGSLQPPAWIHPRILIGSGDMLKPTFVNRYKIGHIINCAGDGAAPDWVKKYFRNQYVCLNAIDSTIGVDILDWFPKFSEAMLRFLREDEDTVFVHCVMGINRSAYLSVAFVCKAYGWDMKKVIADLKKQRPSICQNPTFESQISAFIKETK